VDAGDLNRSGVFEKAYTLEITPVRNLILLLLLLLLLLLYREIRVLEAEGGVRGLSKRFEPSI
jgi:hypothetical protein